MRDEQLDRYINHLPVYIRNMNMVSKYERNKTQILKIRNTLEYSCFSFYKPVFGNIKSLIKYE